MLPDVSCLVNKDYGIKYKCEVHLFLSSNNFVKFLGLCIIK